MAIFAGSAAGPPPDSPANRVDPNLTTSPFAGVGSLRITFPMGVGSTTLATATAISPFHVLTAAHPFDPNFTGGDESNGSDFRLNFGGDLTHIIPVSNVEIHPHWGTGFFNQFLNDDVAVLTLSQAIPFGVPIYDLWTTPLSTGTTLTMVGYGAPGVGDVGITGSASYSIKRSGQNNADSFITDDETFGFNEVFRWDFDGGDATNWMGGMSLGNDIETGLTPGDSGGPAFYDDGGVLKIAGVNTVTDSLIFGSTNTSMMMAGYAAWVAAQSTVIPGDTNNDGQVNALDLSNLAANWLDTERNWAQGDFNGDGVVNALDLSDMGSNWTGATSGQSVAFATVEASGNPLPEPASLTLLSLGAGALLRRPRRAPGGMARL